MGSIVKAVALILFCATSFSQGIRIHPDGGYDIVLAIGQNGETPPENLAGYIENIRSTFVTLSTRMWTATKEKFWLKSLEIVIPPSWASQIETEVSVTMKSFSSADIRVSSNIKSPNAENPNLCGLPGDYIELPSSFFDAANSGEYGVNWKALLVLWTRYRWGAYDEHGYPGDEKFPYFYPADSPAAGENKWLTTGCSSNPQNQLVGTYATLDGQLCDPTSDSALSENCRFWPDPKANDMIDSSLMHFHWMESVTHFCDEKTHKKDVPNRQNLYCNYKSVMETIMSSPDAKAVTAPLDYVKGLTTKITKTTEHPALYVLLDHGLFPFDTQTQQTILNTRMELAKFFESSSIPSDAVAALGTFPASLTSAGVKTVLDFQFVRGNEATFVEAIGHYDLIPNPSYDFSRAIDEAVGAINSVNSLNGGAILLLKTGSITRDAELYYEKDLELRLSRHNISLFAIELPPVNTTDLYLNRLASFSKGQSVNVRDMTAVQQLLTSVGGVISGTTPPSLAQPPTPVWRGDYELGTRVEIPAVENNQLLTFVLVTPVKRNTTDIFGGISTEQVDYGADFTESYEYLDNESPNTRYVYTGVLDTTRMRVKQVEFRADGEGKGRLFVFSEGTDLPIGITVQVYTSASNGIVDLSSVSNANAPFVIYAKVAQNQMPVTGSKVTAMVHLEGTNQSMPVMLADNGDGNADIAPNDGTYSAVFVPPQNGFYAISVTVQKDDSSSSSPKAQTINGFMLLPPSQDFGEPEPAMQIPGGIVEAASLNGIVQFVNRENFKASIQRNTDVNVMYKDPRFTLTFEAPNILGSSDEAPMNFTVYQAATRNDLTGLNLDQDLPAGVEIATKMDVPDSYPGQLISISWEQELDRVFYFALAGGNSTLRSPLSNIVRMGISDNEEPPTQSTDETTEMATEMTTEMSSDGPTGVTDDETENPGTTDSSGATNGTTASTAPPPPEPEPEENTPWIKTGGGIATVVVIVVVIFAAAAGGYYYFKKRQNMNVSHSQSSLRESI